MRLSDIKKILGDVKNEIFYNLLKKFINLEPTISKRFRALFYSFYCQSQLHGYFTEDQIKNLHIAAAAYYQNEGLHDKAISLLVRIGSVREAAAI